MYILYTLSIFIYIHLYTFIDSIYVHWIIKTWNTHIQRAWGIRNCGAPKWPPVNGQNMFFENPAGAWIMVVVYLYIYIYIYTYNIYIYTFDMILPVYIVYQRNTSHQSQREIDPKLRGLRAICVLKAGRKTKIHRQIPPNCDFTQKKLDSMVCHHRPLPPPAVLGALSCIQAASGSTFSSSLWSLARGLKARTIKVPNMMDIAVMAKPGDWEQVKQILNYSSSAQWVEGG